MGGVFLCSGMIPVLKRQATLRLSLIREDTHIHFGLLKFHVEARVEARCTSPNLCACVIALDFVKCNLNRDLRYVCGFHMPFRL